MTAQQHAVRNVALVGPPGSGRSTLARALAERTGGSVHPGGPGELGVVRLVHQGVQLTLLDAPGAPDLAAGRAAALRGADAVLLVVAAASGLDAATVQLWVELEDAGVPRAVVVTGLDQPRADFDEQVAVFQRVLDPEVLPLHVPMHGDDDAVAGLVDVLTLLVSDWSGGERRVRPADPEHVSLLEGLHGDLVEAVLAQSEDPGLLDAWLSDADLEAGALVQELSAAVRAGHLHPVLAVAPRSGVGTTELLDLIVSAFPGPGGAGSPAVAHADGSPAAPLEADADGPLVAEVLRGSGATAVVRVWSGRLTPGTPVHVTGHDGQSRPDVAGAALATGATGPVPLQAARAGDTLSAPAAPLLLEAWDLPEPQLPVAVDAPATALDPVLAGDPSLQLGDWHGQPVLWCVGAAHRDAVLARLGDAATPAELPPSPEPERRWELAITVSPAFTRTVRSDLKGRRGEVLEAGDHPELDHCDLVRALLPEAELPGYALALARVSHGTGRFTRRPAPDA